MGKKEQSVGKKGWQSFNAEDNTHSSSSDLLHLLREYIVLAKPKNCPSILAKTHLYLDQEKRESHHTLKTQSFARTLLVSPPLLSKKSLSFISAQTLLLSPFPHTFPNLQAISSAPPATIHCSSCCLLSKSPTFAPSCSWPLRLDTGGKSYDFWTTPECYRHRSGTSEVSLSPP